MNKRVFNERGDFQAFYAATKWLNELGYSYGSMQRDSPIGIKKGKYIISKWRNLSLKDIANLDGVITGEKRNGPVAVTLYDAGETERPEQDS